jgi:hypothetical protein
MSIEGFSFPDDAYRPPTVDDQSLTLDSKVTLSIRNSLFTHKSDWRCQSFSFD